MRTTRVNLMLSLVCCAQVAACTIVAEGTLHEGDKAPSGKDGGADAGADGGPGSLLPFGGSSGAGPADGMQLPDAGPSSDAGLVRDDGGALADAGSSQRDGGNCGNTSSDADNCGACGYACVNGRSCMDSRCTPAWQVISAVDAPEPRNAHAAVALAGKYVVLGGTLAATGAGPAVASAGRYDPATDTWDTFPSLVQARCGHSAVSTKPEGADAHILTFGGLTECSNGTTNGPGLEVSVDGGAWQALSATGEPPVRYAFAAVPTPRDTFGADLFIYGGSTNTEPAIASGATFALGLGGASAKWTAAECTLPQCERGGHFGMFVDGDHVRVWGGGPYGNAPAGLQYSAGTKTWSTWELPANTPTLPQHYADDGRRIYFLSATSSACPHSVEVLIYDRATSSWQAKDSSSAPAGLLAEAPAAWVGSELIAWSGNCGSGASNVGARYQPPAPGL